METPVTLNVYPLVEELLAEKQIQYKSRSDLVISAELESGVMNPRCSVEEGTFKRVLSNLIDNAAEAIEGNGLILVSVTRFQDMIEIRVTDNGRGINSEIMGKLGQRGASFGKVNGTGLGLYSAKTSVEKWNGALRISSTLNKGTVVRILIPAKFETY